MRDLVQTSESKARVAIVSPFLDKNHGTERCIVELFSRLADEYDIHIYSQQVEDLDLKRMVWHRIPRLPGPHLFNFTWWFLANQFYRWVDRRRGLGYDLVFTPGVNCFDADVIAVYIVFSEFRRQAENSLSLSRNPVRFWPTLIHRTLYYRLVIGLERCIYTSTKNRLTLIAKKTATDLARFYQRREGVDVVYMGLDHGVFNLAERLARRGDIRVELGIDGGSFVLLVVGNDWKKKGLHTIIEAIGNMANLPICLLVVGRDDQTPFTAQIKDVGLTGKVRFLNPRPDVVAYYAAADVYVGPSLEDTFALPPFEAMASGLPVITSSQNGGCEVITDGVDGFVLENPRDSDKLAQLIASLYNDTALRQRVGGAAAQTSEQYTWDKNAQLLDQVFHDVLRRKGYNPPPLASELPAR